MALTMLGNLSNLFQNGNKVVQNGSNDWALGEGRDNVVVQNGSFFHPSTSRLHGDRNAVTQRENDEATIYGDENSVHQQGNGDTVTLGDAGISLTGESGLFGTQVHHDRVEQNGADNHARINGDNATITQNGDGGHARIDGDRSSVSTTGNHDDVKVVGSDVNVAVQGEGNSIDLSSKNGERVSVFGNNLTVRQSNGEIVATDDQGNSVPVRQGADGTIVVGSGPDAETALNGGANCGEQPEVGPGGCIDHYDSDAPRQSTADVGDLLQKSITNAVGGLIFGPLYPLLTAS